MLLIIEYISIFVLIIELIGFLYVIKEIAKTINLYMVGGTIQGTKKHVLDHIMLLGLFAVFNILLHVWLWSHAGIHHSFTLHIVNEGLWAAILLLGVTKIIFIQHLSDERKNRL